MARRDGTPARTIVNGRYAATSASQINDFRRCPRKWYLKKVLRMEEPSTPAQERGTSIHSAFEGFVRTGQVEPDFVPYVMVAQRYLPDESIVVHVEDEMRLPTFDGGPVWVGFIDLWYDDVVVDYKTISDFKYCKTPEELQNDTQMCSYATWRFTQDPSLQVVNVRHIYVLVNKRAAPKAHVVEASISRQQAELIWARDLMTVRQMVDMVAMFVPPAGEIPDRSEEVRPNTESCNAYGGCYFRNHCGIGHIKVESLFRGRNPLKELAKENAIFSVVQTQPHNVHCNPGEVTMSLADKLRAKSAQNGTNGTSAAVVMNTPAPPTPPPAPAAPKSSFADKLKMQMKPDTVSSATPAMSLEQKLALAESKERELQASVAFSGAMNPNASDSSESVESGDVDVEALQALGEVAVSVVPEDAPSLDTKEEVAPSVEQPVAPAKRRGRPPKSTSAVAPAPPAVEQPVGASPSALPVVSRPLRLYIDCFPIKGADRDYVLCEDWIRPIMDGIAEAHAVEDYRLIQYTAKAQLALAVRKAMATVPEVLVVSSYSAGADAVMEQLIPHAQLVVRGK